MIIKTGHGMEEGSKDDIVFELQQPKTSWEICKTSTYDDFSPGETLVWEGSLLEDCEKFMFNAAILSIDFCFIYFDTEHHVYVQKLSCLVSVFSDVIEGFEISLQIKLFYHISQRMNCEFSRVISY